jgi:hypothetical protein
MKTLFAVPLAALVFAACSEPTTPGSALSTREARASDPGITVSGSLTNDLFTFNDGSFTASSGGTFTVEDLDGGFGAAAPTLDGVFNDQANLFLGRVDNHKVTLIVPNGGSTFSVSYDLYIIGSWDGDGKQSGKEYGADVWQNGIACTATGAVVKSLISTTFSNQKGVQQSYPSSYSVPGGGPSKAGTGAYAIDALGYINDPTSHTPLFDSFGDTWYKLSFSGVNPCGAGSAIYLVWTVPNAGLQSNYDESWGIDNVLIKTD